MKEEGSNSWWWGLGFWEGERDSEWPFSWLGNGQRYSKEDNVGENKIRP